VQFVERTLARTPDLVLIRSFEVAYHSLGFLRHFVLVGQQEGIGHVVVVGALDQFQFFQAEARSLLPGSKARLLDLAHPGVVVRGSDAACHGLFTGMPHQVSDSAMGIVLVDEDRDALLPVVVDRETALTCVVGEHGSEFLARPELTCAQLACGCLG
jgi:hypothetical protein